MTPTQRELLSKYLSDVSKGLLLAVAVGVGTNKLSWWYVILALVAAGLTPGRCLWAGRRAQWHPVTSLNGSS